jgi:hypothetical protein
MPLEKIRLSEIFRLVPKPRYIVGTTYTLSLAFFESVVLPCIDRSALRRCVIVADRFGYERALDEATALENAGQSYLVAAPPTDRCLHAKVWFLASEAEAAFHATRGCHQTFQSAHAKIYLINSALSLEECGSGWAAVPSTR